MNIRGLFSPSSVRRGRGGGRLFAGAVFISLFSPCHAALRIVSLAPAATEILFALGLDEEIVGVSLNCDYPLQARSKEKVGTFSRPDAERILRLKPDVVFGTGLEQAPAVNALRRLKVRVVVSDPADLNGLYDSIREIGRLTGREREATALVKQMKRRVDHVAARTRDVLPARRPKVFVEVWHTPLMTAGKGSFVDELVRLAGGVNIASGAPRPYSLFTAEEVLRGRPDCVILTYQGGDDRVLNRLGWGQVPAVLNRRVYGDIDPDLILRPGPRVVDGLEQIQKRLFPKLPVIARSEATKQSPLSSDGRAFLPKRTSP